MKKLKKFIGGLLFVFLIFLVPATSLGMANREGVNWRTNNFDTYIVSVFQAVFGRAPSQGDMDWARQQKTKTDVFWSLINSQEYKNRYNFPLDFNIYKKSKWILAADGGMERMCNCYYYAEFAYDYTMGGRYSFDVARAVVLMNNAFDRDSCPYYDCGYSDLGSNTSSGSTAIVASNNLIQDPNFSNFGSNGGPWGQNVLYGKNGIWWNSGNAQSRAKTVKLNNGKTALYIKNNSGKSAHVYGTTAQRIKTVKGRKYRVSFSGAAKNLASGGALNIAIDPAWKIRVGRMGSGSYGFKKFSGTFTAPANYVDLRLLMEDRGEVWITDMQVQSM